jgi:hypothetical protein
MMVDPDNPAGEQLTTKDIFPELRIFFIDSAAEVYRIMLEQGCGEKIDRVLIHPLHLRYMAERLGMLGSPDQQVQTVIGILSRRLCVLRGRLEHMEKFLVKHSDCESIDLPHLHTYATATAEIAAAFCADLGLQPVSAESEIPAITEKIH